MDFHITQLFWIITFYTFREKLEDAIKVPVARIMQSSTKSRSRRITSLCGHSPIPAVLDGYRHNPEALKEAGIAYATEQIIDLLSSGVDGIHLYTMNRPAVAKQIFGQIHGIRQHLKAET